MIKLVSFHHADRFAERFGDRLGDHGPGAPGCWATDEDHDLAVLKADAQDLPTARLGNSTAIAFGERVVAVGYALSLAGGPTVTSGIISSLQRTIEVQDERSFPSCGRIVMSSRRMRR